MVVEGEQFNKAAYWQFKPLSIEWLYVMQKLKDSVMPPAGIQHCYIGTGWDGSTLYLLSKKFYTAETISKATGLPVEKLQAHTDAISLKVKPVEGLPEATVTYWGTA